MSEPLDEVLEGEIVSDSVRAIVPAQHEALSAETSRRENPQPKMSAGFYFQLSVFWFAVSFLWSGLITIVIQSRVAQIAPNSKDLALGATLALGALVSTLVCYYVGAHSDRAHLNGASRWARKWGRRSPYIIVGTLGTLPFLLALPWANSILLLVILMCGIQFWVNIATAPYQALIPDLVPKSKQGVASSWMGMSSLLGTSFGLIGYNALYNRPGGFLLTMSVVSALLVLSAGFTVWRVRDKAPDEAALGEEQAQVLAGTAKDSFDWKEAWRENPSFFWLIASRFFINLGFYSATEFLLYYVSDTLRPPNPGEVVKNFFLISTVAGLIGNFPAGFVADRLSKKLVVWISLGITAVGAAIFLSASSVQTATYAAWIFGAGYGAFLAVDWALATNLLPPRDEARWMGIWHGAFTVPQVVAPIIGGFVAHFVNQSAGAGQGYRAVLALVLVYLFIGAVMVAPIREKSVISEAERHG
jgi:Na+/melibiose symporter-like transporter